MGLKISLKVADVTPIVVHDVTIHGFLLQKEIGKEVLAEIHFLPFSRYFNISGSKI